MSEAPIKKRLAIADLSKNIVPPELCVSEDNKPIERNTPKAQTDNDHLQKHYDKSRVVELLLQPKNYANGRQPVVIDEELKEKIDAISRLTNLSIANIVNNALCIFLGDDAEYSINTELKDVISKKKSNLFKTL